MKVYVVLWDGGETGMYTGSEVIGVFLSKEGAEEARTKNIAQFRRRSSDYEFMEFGRWSGDYEFLEFEVKP